ncbi:sialidase family protein [Mucilaginibacter lacusdianchii]|uniref:sialidase family protein n=1 Tax=Mucilaginibacter lacusdianchii TaxID=2684211 RepID=UPI00131B769C|nr:sialidase family protein [Mucilaginibacter sp. JXJ CY 39]
MKNFRWLIFILFAFAVASCRESNRHSNAANEAAPRDKSRPELKIRWDSIGKKISHDVYFAEYGRISRLNKDTLLLTYHCGSKGNEWDNIVLRRSFNNGKSWEKPKVVVPDSIPRRYYGFSTPELLRLRNGWMLLAFTGRGRPDDSTHNNIQVCISKNAGHTWSKPQMIAIGRSWEPGMVQLPNGEIQLFFSTELVSSKGAGGRHEQKLMIMTSNDNGWHWQQPKPVAFVKGRRDGMPVPVVLKNHKGIVAVFESVGNPKSPCFIWSSEKAQFKYDSLATEQNGRRWCGTSNVWGGAPYLVQLPSGETIISVQDDGGRKIDRFKGWKKSTMLVLVGNSMAQNFSQKSYPWPNLPVTDGAYFNSLFLKDDSTLVAVSTRNFKDERSEIWYKEGHISH